MAKAVNAIRCVGGHNEGAHTYYPVVIIGAGESGIAMGCRLRSQLGCDQFRIFERKSGIGGTWYSSRYPGIACDIPAVCYSYSWAQNFGWSALHPSGPEILAYLHDVCQRFQILDKIQTHTNVASMRWLDHEDEWELVLEHMCEDVGELSSKERQALADSQGHGAAYSRTETIRAKVIASAAGGLVEPKAHPNIPGLDRFKGEVVHTARWDPKIKLQDKNVVVLGSGCTAAQVTPEIVKSPHNAKSVIQLLRSPGWAHPTVPRAMEKWWEANTPTLFSRIPGLQRIVRKLFFAILETEFQRLFTWNPQAHENRLKAQKSMVTYMHALVPEKYWEILTPDFEFGCKRRIVDTQWFRGLQNPKIEISSLPLTSIQEHAVTLGPGRHYPPMSKTDSKAPTAERVVPCDTLILAHGYETGGWLHPLDVRGRNGRSLYDVWNERGGNQAYQGTAMDGFPNFFLIFGPNTATGHSSVILASENMVNYSLNFIKPILNGDVTTYEVKEAAERKWTAEVQRALENSIWMRGGCTSWYYTESKDVDSSGSGSSSRWNATMYPWSQVHFTLRCMFPYWSDWNVVYTRRGLVRKRIRLFVRVLGLVAVMAVVVCVRRPSGASSLLSGMGNLLRRGIRALDDTLHAWLQNAV